MSGPALPRTRSDLEVQIGRAVIHLEKEFMGRGPLETKTYLLDDLILIRLKGVLTPAERKLSESQNDRSAYLLKQVRNELLSTCRPMLETVVRDIVGENVQSVHTDISTKTGERVIVITLQKKPEFDRDDRESTWSKRGTDEDAAANSTAFQYETGPHRDGDRRPSLT